MDMIEADTPEGVVATKKALEFLESCASMASDTDAARLSVALQIVTNSVMMQEKLTGGDLIAVVGTLAGWLLSDIKSRDARVLAFGEMISIAMMVSEEVEPGNDRPTMGVAQGRA